MCLRSTVPLVIIFTYCRQIQKTENTPQYLARPVRRSTRLSRSGFVSTPGVKLCSSLNEVDESVRKNMSFKGNKLLL